VYRRHPSLWGDEDEEEEEEDEDLIPPQRFVQNAPVDYPSPQYYQMQGAMERRLHQGYSPVAGLSPDDEEFFQQHHHVHYEDQDVETDAHAEMLTMSDLEDQGEV
jgi:hypothetical protein